MTQATFDLAAAAQEEMIREGFDVPSQHGADAQIGALKSRVSVSVSADGGRDLRALPWSSIDNDNSRDLDQAEVAEPSTDGGTVVRVAIADVAELVLKGSALDVFAAKQTQTVYTAVRNFPMLPVELSNDLTSLNESGDRAAVVTEFTVGPEGELRGGDVYEAVIRNAAQLAYSTVGPWLEGRGGAVGEVSVSNSLQEQLRLQADASTRLHRRRQAEGALDFTRAEADLRVVDGQVQSIGLAQRSAATTLIEELMIATNETVSRVLCEAKRSCLHRVVRAPERWPRMVEVAARYGVELPAEADSAALNAFLQEQRAKDPDHYPELALTMIKLMGPGQYALSPGSAETKEGHFGLAAKEYTHATAPNRRFADLVMQRVLKAMLRGEEAPYSDDELAAIAVQCNDRERAARKVERAMEKREAAVALSGKVGSVFRGVVTGASAKGTYVRVQDPPVEGRVVEREQGLDVGDRFDVVLLRTDPARAYIDFRRV